MNTRIEVDRREKPTPFWSRYVLVGGRRATRRRGDDPEAIYVDRIGMSFGALLLTLFVFHVLDATFTLGHLRAGGVELNPFMDILIKRDPALFLWVKLGMAGLGLFLLGRHKFFPHVKRASYFLFTVYALLTVYHFVLFLART